MRTHTTLPPFLALLALLASPAGAGDGDGAPDLFYRAFWIEQSGGDAARAEALYREVLEQHRGSPEAPRALLGLIRLGAAGGADVTDLVRRLETDYADAKDLIERARETVAAARAPFDAVARPGDTPAGRKIKSLFFDLLEREVSSDNVALLADLGPRGHPMLAALLRQDDYRPVRRAAQILLRQRTPEAHAVLEQALRDERVLFRTTIVDELSRHEGLSDTLFAAIADLYDGAGPNLRQSIVNAAYYRLAEPEGRAREIVTRALSDADPQVRARALRVCTGDPSHLSASVKAAFVRGFEASLPEAPVSPAELLRLEDRRLDAAVEAVLVRCPRFEWPQGVPLSEPAARSLARVVLARRAKQPEDQRQNAMRAAGASPAAAMLLLRTAIERPDPGLAGWVVRDADEDRTLHADLATSLAPDDLASLKAFAMEALYGDDAERSKAAGILLGRLKLGAGDADAVLATIRKHQDRGILEELLPAAVVQAIGARGALQLVEACRGRADFHVLLWRCIDFAKPENADRADAAALFAAIVPQAEPGAYQALRALAFAAPELQAILVTHMLSSDEPQWGWELPGRGRPRNQPGPSLLEGANKAWDLEGPRAALYAAAADARKEVAMLSVLTADRRKDEGSTGALITALDSPWKDIRARAIQELADRGAAAADALVAYLRRPGPTEVDLAFWALAKCGGTGHAAVAREYLGHREQDCSGAWQAYGRLAPAESVELALAVLEGKEGSAAYRTSALRLLTRTADARRVKIFRWVLLGELDADIAIVLETVANQYLIELGEETLRHLRNPDPAIRSAAKRAIESLKFYAEARNAFRD